MSCFSVVPVQSLDEQEWVVMRDGFQVAGPFHTPEEAQAVALDMEKAEALDEIRQQAKTLNQPIRDMISAEGPCIGRAVLMNQHYVVFNEGQNANIRDLAPFKQGAIELSLGEMIVATIKDGQATLSRIKAKSSLGMSR